MFEGLVSLILSYVVNISLQPYYNQYTNLKINQGYPLESVKTELLTFEMAVQMLAFVVVFGIIKLLKFLFNNN